MRSVQSTLKGLFVVSSVVAVVAFGLSQNAQPSTTSQRDRVNPRPVPSAPQAGTPRAKIIILYDPNETPQSQVRQIEDEFNRLAPNGVFPASIDEDKDGKPDEQYAQFIRKLNEEFQKNPKNPVLLVPKPEPCNPVSPQEFCYYINAWRCVCIRKWYEFPDLQHTQRAAPPTSQSDDASETSDSGRRNPSTGNVSSTGRLQMNREQLIDSIARGSRLILVLVGSQFQQQARNQPWDWWEENVFRPLAQQASGKPVASLSIKEKSSHYPR